MVTPGSHRERFLSYRTVISCLEQQDRHQSTGMYLFEEKTRVCWPETREDRNCIGCVNMVFFKMYYTLMKRIAQV
jgi:hypothetical protein